MPSNPSRPVTARPYHGLDSADPSAHATARPTASTAAVTGQPELQARPPTSRAIPWLGARRCPASHLISRRMPSRPSSPARAALALPPSALSLEVCPPPPPARPSLGFPQSRDARRSPRDPAARPPPTHPTAQAATSRTCTSTTPPPWPGRTCPPQRPARPRLPEAVTASRRRGASSTCTGAMVTVVSSSVWKGRDAAGRRVVARGAGSCSCGYMLQSI